MFRGVWCDPEQGCSSSSGPSSKEPWNRSEVRGLCLSLPRQPSLVGAGLEFLPEAAAPSGTPVSSNVSVKTVAKSKGSTSGKPPSACNHGSMIWVRFGDHGSGGTSSLTVSSRAEGLRRLCSHGRHTGREARSRRPGGGDSIWVDGARGDLPAGHDLRSFLLSWGPSPSYPL